MIDYLNKLKNIISEKISFFDLYKTNIDKDLNSELAVEYMNLDNDLFNLNNELDSELK